MNNKFLRIGLIIAGVLLIKLFSGTASLAVDDKKVERNAKTCKELGIDMNEFGNCVQKNGIADSVSTDKNATSKEITWSEMVAKINEARFESVGQNHNLNVSLVMPDGTVLKAKEPKIDAVFEVIKNCKECQNKPLLTE